MIDNEKIFNDDFLDSEAFLKWHKSFTDIIMLFKEVLHPELKPETINADKERIIGLKVNLIIKSIELGLYFKKLEEKEILNE